jgi:hypothetical protein
MQALVLSAAKVKERTAQGHFKANVQEQAIVAEKRIGWTIATMPSHL